MIGVRVLAQPHLRLSAVIQQHPGFNFEPASNARNVVDRYIAFGPLDAAEVCAVDAALVGQCLLTEATLRPKAAHIPRQNVSQRSFVSLFHKGDFGSLPLLRRPLLSYIRGRSLIFLPNGGDMRLGWPTVAACLISFAPLGAAKAQEVDPSAVIDQLTRWTMEDIARQRAEAREREAADRARRSLPDLSQYGTPLEDPAPRENCRNDRTKFTVEQWTLAVVKWRCTVFNDALPSGPAYCKVCRSLVTDARRGAFDAA
jgi:hypothetical protein